MATGNNIAQLLADPTLKVDPDWAIGMINACPTFVLPAALLLKRNPQDVDLETRKRLQAIVLLGSPDRTAISDFANFNGCDWADFYPPMDPPEQKTTEATIDDFLETYGHGTPKDDALLEKLLFNPVAPDYMESLEKEEKAKAEKQAETDAAAQNEAAEDVQEPKKAQPAPEVEIIDTAPAEKATEVMQEGANDAEEPLLMESLAKIFIKQRRYERAFEIINSLSLKYPEKSVYFADQLRFLQLLIINNKKKSNN